MSHICVDITCLPLARETLSGQVIGRLLTTGVTSITKIWVAPESAIALSVASKMLPLQFQSLQCV
jgi:hypothetical protein